MSETNATDERVEKPYPAQKARGGEIILKSKWSRVVFLAGLFGGAVLAIVVAIYWGAAG